MFYNIQHRYSSQAYKSDMQALWKENADLSMHYINNSVNQSPTAQQWGLALNNNQQKISNGIIKFYGDSRKVSTLFLQFIQYLGEAVNVVLLKRNIKEFRKRWYAKADELSNLLDTFTVWNMRSYFYKQINIYEAIIKSFVNKDISSQNRAYNELLNNNRAIADTFSNGVINHNKNLFV